MKLISFICAASVERVVDDVDVVVNAEDDPP